MRIINDIIYRLVDFAYISPIINLIESEKEQYKKVLHVTDEDTLALNSKDKLMHIISLLLCYKKLKKWFHFISEINILECKKC